MIFRKIIIAFIALFAFATSSNAQEVQKFDLHTGLAFVPQYTIKGGLRLDFDKSISKTSNQWIIVSPQLFMVSGNRYNHNFEELWGVGMDLKHKIYLKPGSMRPEGYYVQYGGMFQYFSITDTRDYAITYIENGIEYHGVEWGKIATNLYKVGGNFHLGYQWLIGDKLFIDIYTGAGIRLSFNNRNKGFDTWYNDSWVDYGYSGTLMDAGFRIGFFF